MNLADDHHPTTGPFSKAPHTHRVSGPKKLDPKGVLVASTHLDDSDPWGAGRTQ